MNNKEKIIKQIQEMPSLANLREDSPLFDSRKAKTKRILQSIFGEDSSQFGDFRSVSYFPSVLTYDTTEGEKYNAYLKGLNTAKLLLEGMLDEVDEDPQEIEMLDINIDFRKLIHPDIIKIAKSRFESGHYADAVEASFKEINFLVKEICKERTKEQKDGSDLMKYAFSLRDPVIKLGDLDTSDGKNIQLGYIEIFAGSMTGIRNPKAHSNLVLSKEKCIHFLFLASLLRSKIDEEIK